MPAINHRPLFVLQRNDGVLMPAIKGGKGGTYVDPDKPDGQPPRLFHNTTAAKNCLAWWAAGRVKTRYEEDYGNVIVGVTPIEGRSMEDWEIVPVQLCTLTLMEPANG